MTLRPSLNRRAFALGAGAFGLGLGGLARAATFPQQRVAITVPFSAGTAVDLVARFLAARLSQQWKQPVFVDNRNGGNGVIGTVAVKMAGEDGHTILFTGPPLLFVPETNLRAGYDALRDFRPVARVTAPVFMLAAHPATPYASFKELVEHAKRSSGKLDVAVAGDLGAMTVTGMLQAAGVGPKLNMVKYTTTGQLLSDATAGHVPLVLSSLSSLSALTTSAKLKALAVSGPTRSIVLPDVPTAMEAGAHGFSLVSWNGAFVRAGTPDDVVATIEDGIRRATAVPDFVELCRANGLEPAFKDGAEWAKDLPTERIYLKDLLRQTGLLEAK